MSEICAKCGLPQDLCVCETIAKEAQAILVSLEKRKFGKAYTVIKGLNEHEIDLKDLAKKLKNRFACGGTAKDGMIELQGKHLKTMKTELAKLGFAPESIEIREFKRKR